MMMLTCIKQHLSNTWSSIHEKITNTEIELKKSVAYKKARTWVLPELRIFLIKHDQCLYSLRSLYSSFSVCWWSNETKIISWLTDKMLEHFQSHALAVQILPTTIDFMEKELASAGIENCCCFS